jgi:hypothetical protein
MWVYEDGPSGYIRRKMESHGWTISAIEYVEDWGTDRSFGDIEGDWDHGYSYYNKCALPHALVPHLRHFAFAGE